MDKYDSALLGILQNEGKIDPFLDVVLSFLYRRTDYFHIMKTDRDNLGFPPGVARKLLMNIFSKYEAQALKTIEKSEGVKKRTVAQPKRDTTSAATVVANSPCPAPPSKDTTPTVPSEHSPSLPTPKGTDVGNTGKTDNDNSVDNKVTEVRKETTEQKSSASKTEEAEDEETEDQKRQRRELQSNPLTYNGAERDNYFWSQTISEADVRVKVPKSIVKGKQVKVNIAKKRISVSYQAQDGSWQSVVDGALAWDVDTEESMWTITPGEFVHINLEKKEERWWECMFEDEPKINTRKIDCSRPMTELDDEAQAKIEEMMYNQRQKQLGLPQSHEQKTHDILRKAWDAEGSPFKGQPFDPSVLNVDNNGVVNVNQP